MALTTPPSFDQEPSVDDESIGTEILKNIDSVNNITLILSSSPSNSLWLSLARSAMLVNETSFDDQSSSISSNTANIQLELINGTNLNNNNSSTANDNEEYNEFYSDLMTVLVYSLIIIVSLCGNSLVLRMILAKKKLQTTTNVLIAWLAVSDLLTTTLNIPFNVARFLAMNYPFPALFCKLVPFIQVMCVYVSTLIMGVIAVHRYMTVTSSTTTHRTSINTGGGHSSHGILSGSGGHSYLSGGLVNGIIRPLIMKGSMCLCAIVTVVWLLAGLLATPHSMFNQIVYVPYKNKTYKRCRAEYPKVDFNVRFVLSLEAFLTQYLIPLGLICVLYIKIGSVVAKQGRVAQKANSRRKMEQDSARRRRLTMLILVVLVFGICWMPLNLYHLLVDFHLIKSNFTIFLVCHWIAMSSVCWNPFIYCWLNESFRKGATRMIIFICCCCCPKMRQKIFSGKKSSSPTSSTNQDIRNHSNNNKKGTPLSTATTPTTTITTTTGSSSGSSSDHKKGNGNGNQNFLKPSIKLSSNCSKNSEDNEAHQKHHHKHHHHHDSRKTFQNNENNDNNDDNDNKKKMKIHHRNSSSTSSSETTTSCDAIINYHQNNDITTTTTTTTATIINQKSNNSSSKTANSQVQNITYKVNNNNDNFTKGKQAVITQKSRRKFHKLRSFSFRRKDRNCQVPTNTTTTTTITTKLVDGIILNENTNNLIKNQIKNKNKNKNNNNHTNNTNNSNSNKNNFIILIDSNDSNTSTTTNFEIDAEINNNNNNNVIVNNDNVNNIVNGIQNTDLDIESLKGDEPIIKSTFV